MPVTKLKGVSDRKAKALAEMGITSLADLLTHYPRRYVDRSREASIDELERDEQGLVLVRITSVTSRRTRNRRTMVLVEAAGLAEGGGRLRLTFFNQPWRERQLRPGIEAAVFGKLEYFRGQRQMTNPVVDVIRDDGAGSQRTGRIVPIYPQSEKAGLNTWELAALVEEAIARTVGRASGTGRGFADPVPAAVLRRHGLVDRGRALRGIHAPEDMAAQQEARRRLVFDELLRVQVALVARKRHLEATTRGVTHTTDGPLVERFRERLPFPLTRAQQKAVDRIVDDLGRRYPMHRLLQGDVGAGKTVVAVAALLVAVQGGHQGALMAPTEVLAEQHHIGIAELLAGFTVGDEATLMGERPLRVALLTNRVAAAERRRVLADLAGGAVDIVVGTHALIQEGVDFASLGVAVIDEQHRFGVEQRAALRDRPDGSPPPDVLVMTATPIPRTAAMTVYGDLDVSILDELPPGRTPIVTRWARGEAEEESVWAQVRDEVAQGRQAYVVCPLIEESDRLEARSAEETHDRLTAGELAGLRVGLLHGRLKAPQKEEVMADFRAGRLDVLVATTVIEVGVDVPNATVMIVLDADRFGIAQLHQLRGRVGRGAHASTCWLVSEPGDGDEDAGDSSARLSALVETTDGFKLAEVDLDLRGEGTLMGERQTGRNDLKLASLRRDKEWVLHAREAASDIVDDDPSLSSHPDLAAEVELIVAEEDAEFLLKS
ncbi:MAG: ATP-dependent DNA helicase RecG [Actinomycetota bacterium]|nr:ATP-dependent DNA helicase RecG [Actinomycetota bacterium]